MYLSCEDREGVLHWRLARTTAHLGISHRGRCAAGSRSLISSAMTSCCGRKIHRPEELIRLPSDDLQERIEKHATELLIVDGVSDTYGGNENARTEVKRYVNALVSLIPADRGAVLLLGHIAKPTASAAQSTEGYSGSTGWHNSVRARWYLHPETVQGDDGESWEQSGDLILDLQKSNLGRVDQSMRFAWDATAHLFVGREIVDAAALDRAHRDRIEHRDVLRAFQGCATRGIHVPAADVRTAHGLSRAVGCTRISGHFEARRKGFERPISTCHGVFASVRCASSGFIHGRSPSQARRSDLIYKRESANAANDAFRN